MQFFIHCNFFCQKYKSTYLLTDLLFGDRLRKKLLRHYLKSKTNKNFKVSLGYITSTINSYYFSVVCVVFRSTNDLAIII